MKNFNAEILIIEKLGCSGKCNDGNGEKAFYHGITFVRDIAGAEFIPWNQFNPSALGYGRREWS